MAVRTDLTWHVFILSNLCILVTAIYLFLESEEMVYLFARVVLFAGLRDGAGLDGSNERLMRNL